LPELKLGHEGLPEENEYQEKLFLEIRPFASPFPMRDAGPQKLLGIGYAAH